MKNWLELPKVSMVDRQRFSLFNFEGTFLADHRGDAAR